MDGYEIATLCLVVSALSIFAGFAAGRGYDRDKRKMEERG